MSPDVARRFIEREVSELKRAHLTAWRSYQEHKKALSGLIAAEPQKPKIFGVAKWKLEHGKWAKERDSLATQIASDLEALGVKSSTNNAEKEADELHGRYDQIATEEALRQNPEAAAVIREDDERRGLEERAKREAEEARVREENETYRSFRAAIRELAAKHGEKASIVTSARDGRSYGGLLLGLVENNGISYAAQSIGDGHVILHYATQDQLPRISALVGKNVEISFREDRIGEITEEILLQERNRRRSR
jgi:hypothetical protein